MPGCEIRQEVDYWLSMILLLLVVIEYLAIPMDIRQVKNNPKAVIASPCSYGNSSIAMPPGILITVFLA